MREFKLPSLGADMDDGTLLEWRVKPGEAVARGQVVAVVDTTKAAIDVECWDEGTVEALLVEPGTKILVGTPMALLRDPGESSQAVAQWKARRATAEAASSGGAVAVAAEERAEPSAHAPEPAEHKRISPAARRRAHDLGVELDTVTGTGPKGAVTLDDIARAAAQVKPTSIPDAARAPPAAIAADRAAEMRRTIAAAMARSKREIPHYYLSTDIALAAATKWLAAENEKRPVTERILMAALFIKAVAKALGKYPDLNGFIRDGIREPSATAHVGVAISLRQGGLIAPALMDTAAKPLDQIMRELADLVKRARAFTLRSSEFSMPTITVTNLGDQGVDAVVGVIYPPQVAIVGFGKVADRVVAVDGAIAVRPVVTVSLSADHRASDGHRGALFLNELSDLLQHPEAL